MIVGIVVCCVVVIGFKFEVFVCFIYLNLYDL